MIIVELILFSFLFTYGFSLIYQTFVFAGIIEIVYIHHIIEIALFSMYQLWLNSIITKM